MRLRNGFGCPCGLPKPANGSKEIRRLNLCAFWTVKCHVVQSENTSCFSSILYECLQQSVRQPPRQPWQGPCSPSAAAFSLKPQTALLSDWSPVRSSSCPFRLFAISFPLAQIAFFHLCGGLAGLAGRGRQAAGPPAARHRARCTGIIVRGEGRCLTPVVLCLLDTARSAVRCRSRCADIVDYVGRHVCGWRAGASHRASRRSALRGAARTSLSVRLPSLSTARFPPSLKCTPRNACPLSA